MSDFQTIIICITVLAVVYIIVAYKIEKLNTEELEEKLDTLHEKLKEILKNKLEELDKY